MCNAFSLEIVGNFFLTYLRFSYILALDKFVYM
jgi:hypothetical protein